MPGASHGRTVTPAGQPKGITMSYEKPQIENKAQVEGLMGQGHKGGYAG
jgi:hypothetical protein